MAYSIVYKKSVRHDLKRLPKEQARRILDQIDKELPTKANSYPALKGQFTGLRKLRVGDFGIIYAVVGDDVLILRIGHRNDIYKKEI